MKFIGTAILVIVALFALGTVIAPFAAAIYAISVFSLTQVIKGALILYVAMIPISMFVSASKG